MARKKTSRKSHQALFSRVGMHSQIDEPTLLDVLDTVLNRGVVLNGDLILGVANVDLIYAKLSVLLAALDKVMGESSSTRGRRGRESGAVFRPVAAGRRGKKVKVESRK